MKITEPKKKKMVYIFSREQEYSPLFLLHVLSSFNQLSLTTKAQLISAATENKIYFFYAYNKRSESSSGCSSHSYQLNGENVLVWKTLLYFSRHLKPSFSKLSLKHTRSFFLFLSFCRFSNVFFFLSSVLRATEIWEKEKREKNVAVVPISRHWSNRPNRLNEWAKPTKTKVIYRERHRILYIICKMGKKETEKKKKKTEQMNFNDGSMKISIRARTT